MYALVYDSGCGPCTRFRNLVGFFDVKGRMKYLGLGEADQAGVLNSVDPCRRHRSFHLVSPGGEVWSGAAALPPLLGLLPAGRPVSSIARCPPVFAALAGAYSVMARLHDAGSCTYPGRPPEPQK